MFFLLGSLWIWRIGLQNDEVLFAGGIYPPFVRGDSVRAWGYHLPLMVMTYVGTLKAMLYRALVFPFFEPSGASVRIPALLIGCLSVWLFYRLLLRVSGQRAALAGTALLATDTTYMLTIRWDWGPVAVQHVCLIGGVLALLRYWQTRRPREVSLGFFIFGLGLWDKALFSWSLAALGVCALIFYPRFVRELLRPRIFARATVAFLLGALPLVIYNVRHEGITFRSNTEWSAELLSHKARLIWYALDGSGLFGTIMREDWDGPLKPPDTPSEQALVALSDAVGMPRESIAAWVFVAGLAALPFARRTWRPAVFALLFGALVWAQMAMLRNAGTGLHHTILLWPVPPFVTALTLAEGSQRIRRAGLPLLAGLVVIGCVSNVLVLSTYYTNMIRNGGVPAWTEALWPAADAVREMKPLELLVVDWGFYEPIRLLHKGQTALGVATDPVDAQTREWALAQVREPRNVFIAHTPPNEFNTGAHQRLVAFAEKEGYTLTDVRMFMDFNGRPVIQTYRFRPK
jgi:hypothetical protein